jgi:dGTPase
MSDGAELDSIQPGRIGPAVRLRLEEREESLSPFAAKSTRGRGRTIPEDPSPLRTEYQRDRDRIVHAKAFRRLKHKTQVFIAPQGDHYVTRLTHTLEVSQIARTISRALDLNEDLTEAIALGHDLGHTPFGHVGEEALNALDPRGFLHAQQSLRTVELLEKDGKGLNLTWEVRRGIVSHSKPRGDFLAGATDHVTLEGQVVRISDAVAYLNHDVADGFRAGVMSPGDLPEIVTGTLGDRHSQRVDTMVTDIVDSSWRSTGAGATDSGPPPTISMGARVREAVYALREFMFERVYKPDDTGGDGTAARRIIELLYDHYLHHPDEVPPEYRLEGTEPDQTVSDYIAGMTDHFAIRAAEKIEPGSGGNFMSRLL